MPNDESDVDDISHYSNEEADISTAHSDHTTQNNVFTLIEAANTQPNLSSATPIEPQLKGYSVKPPQNTQDKHYTISYAASGATRPSEVAKVTADGTSFSMQKPTEHTALLTLLCEQFAKNPAHKPSMVNIKGMDKDKAVSLIKAMIDGFIKAGKADEFPNLVKINKADLSPYTIDALEQLNSATGADSKYAGKIKFNGPDTPALR